MIQLIPLINTEELKNVEYALTTRLGFILNGTSQDMKMREYLHYTGMASTRVDTINKTLLWQR